MNFILQDIKIKYDLNREVAGQQYDTWSENSFWVLRNSHIQPWEGPWLSS